MTLKMCFLVPPLNRSQDEIASFLFHHNTGAFAWHGSIFYKKNKITEDWLRAPVKVPFETNHGNVALTAAPGDFMLMHRAAWSYMRGHPELPLIELLDDVVVWLAVAMGMQAVRSRQVDKFILQLIFATQATFNAPVAMYHLYHASRQYSSAKNVLQ